MSTSYHTIGEIGLCLSTTLRNRTYHGVVCAPRGMRDEGKAFHVLERHLQGRVLHMPRCSGQLPRIARTRKRDTAITKAGIERATACELRSCTEGQLGGGGTNHSVRAPEQEEWARGVVASDGIQHTLREEMIGIGAADEGPNDGAVGCACMRGKCKCSPRIICTWHLIPSMMHATAGGRQTASRDDAI